MSEYQYNIVDYFINDIVNVDTFTEEIEESSITKELDYILIGGGDCHIYFTTALSGPEETTLSGVVTSHLGLPPVVIVPPVMDDGRPIIRADTRPLDTATYFTCASDTASGIGDGRPLRWDFSPDSEYTTISGPYVLSCGCNIPEGFNAQVIDLVFLDSIYLKDGSIYFFDTPWGAHCNMTIIVPAGNYYPNDHGTIPASALGLSGKQMYSYAATDTPYYRYVNRHYMYGSCSMGDDMNAEGCMVDALPAGWIIRGVILTPNTDNVSKGFASYEMYRHRTRILTGDTP